MSHGHPFISQRAIDIIVEDKLAAAYQRGEFDNLPGFGKPDPVIDEPYDPNWWIRSKLAREGLGSGSIQG
jgi:hypothetical protein